MGEMGAADRDAADRTVGAAGSATARPAVADPAEAPDELAMSAAPAPPSAELPATRPDDAAERVVPAEGVVPAAEPRRATRIAEGAWLGGVCTGLARHLRLPVLAVRMAFVLLFPVQFVGAVVYAVLWLLLPAERRHDAVGLQSHERTGMRQADRAPRRGADLGSILALCAIGVGMTWLIQLTGLGLDWRVFWPIALACGGGGLMWRQADLAMQRAPAGADEGRRSWLTPLLARGGWQAALRVVVGLCLVVGAIGLVILMQGNLRMLPQVLAMTALALGGVLIVVAPWLYRLRQLISQSREEQVRADARADMAAHLHDSVLQTLALIQRQAADPKAVQRLARRQERELRSWLYGDEAAASTLKAALAEEAAEVEDEHGVPIEVICVGDFELDTSGRALVMATREAMVNAAKHSGAPRIDVYAEAGDGSVEVFVRDRGRGFDPTRIAEDRMGVRGSIMDRMERHGGAATIRSSAETGTEVRLEMSR